MSKHYLRRDQIEALVDELQEFLQACDECDAEPKVKIVAQPGYPMIVGLNGWTINSETEEFIIGLTGHLDYASDSDTEGLDGF